jgi:antitoxin (DNA-binding transcriptional repressor) of toxin-antitoxin stability system
MLQRFHKDEAREHLDDLIEAALRGDTIIITGDDEKSVQLVPLEATKKRRTGTAKGLIHMSEDFDEYQ